MSSIKNGFSANIGKRFIAVVLTSVTMVGAWACADKEESSDVTVNNGTPAVVTFGVPQNTYSTQTEYTTVTQSEIAQSDVTTVKIGGKIQNNESPNLEFNLPEETPVPIKLKYCQFEIPSSYKEDKSIARPDEEKFWRSLTIDLYTDGKVSNLSGQKAASYCDGVIDKFGDSETKVICDGTESRKSKSGVEYKPIIVKLTSNDNKNKFDYFIAYMDEDRDMGISFDMYIYKADTESAERVERQALELLDSVILF